MSLIWRNPQLQTEAHHWQDHGTVRGRSRNVPSNAILRCILIRVPGCARARLRYHAGMHWRGRDLIDQAYKILTGGFVARFEAGRTQAPLYFPGALVISDTPRGKFRVKPSPWECQGVQERPFPCLPSKVRWLSRVKPFVPWKNHGEILERHFVRQPT